MLTITFLKYFKFDFRYHLILVLGLTVLCLVSILTTPFFFLQTDQETGNLKNLAQSDLGTGEGPTLGEATIAARVGVYSQVKGAKEEVSKGTSEGIYLGMWTQGLFDPEAFTLHPDKLREVESKIGKKVAIAHYYRGWEELGKDLIVPELNLISQNGWRPMISANPYFFKECSSNGLTLYKAIASGNCDSFLHSAAQNLKKYAKPLLLRFAWEMNIDSMEWSVRRTGDKPSDFVSAWRRFHNVVKEEEADNVAWVWSPDVGSLQNPSYRDLYPGDSYVDWLGLDGYNWGKTQTWSTWKTFDQIFSAPYKEITSLSQKPLMIAEVNSTDLGGDKPAWYLNALTATLLKNFPRVKAIVFYNEDRSQKENVNWLIDISKETLQAFKEGISNPIYRSSF